MHGWVNPANGARPTMPKLSAVLCNLCGHEYVQIDKHINKRHAHQLKELANWLGNDSTIVQRLKMKEKQRAKRVLTHL